MRKSLIITILATIALPMVAQGQDNVTIVTLDDCRRMAAENNASVKVATANATAADEVRKEAFTKYFPTVQATGTWFHSNKPVFHYTFDDLITLEFMKKGVGASIYAIQPVFAGGRIVNGNKLAEVGVQAGQLERQNAVNQAQLTAEQYYWQLVTLKSEKRTLQSVIDMVDTLANQVDVAVRAGVVNRNDLLKVQLQQNDFKSTMVDLDNGIALASKLLAQYIGLDGQPIDIADADVPDELPPYPTNLYIAPDQAVTATADYQLLEKQVQAAELEKRMAVGSNMPTVGVGAGYFYDDLLSQKYSFGAVFVSVNVPISGWWGGSHNIKKADLAVSNARTQMNDLSQMLRLKIDDTWDDLTAAHRKMAIASESITSATENLRISRNYYDAGVSSITDLLDAQTMYRQALDQYTQAYGAFCLARARYLNATAQNQ